MNIVLLLAPIQAFFLFSLLLAKQQKSFADKVLLAWLIGIGAHTLIYFLHFQFQLAVPLVLNLNSAFPFLRCRTLSSPAAFAGSGRSLPVWV